MISRVLQETHCQVSTMANDSDIEMQNLVKAVRSRIRIFTGDENYLNESLIFPLLDIKT
jgi:hypothetical protein